MVKLEGVVMILDLHRQGLTVTEIARQCGLDRKTVRRTIKRGLEPPAYGPRKPRPTLLAPFTGYLRERVTTYPGLTGSRLLRELKKRGYEGSYTAITDFLRNVRPIVDPPFEVRFETAPGEQGQVDFARFNVVFTDEPTTPRIIWLFSMVLGYSRLIWARFVMHQDLPTVLRCHAAAFEAIGGAPREILYDRMKTAVTGASDCDGIVYNRALIDLARHYSFFQKPVSLTGRRPKAKWNDRSATFGKTSSSRAASAIWTIYLLGEGLVDDAARGRVHARVRDGSCTCVHCRWRRSGRCCGSSVASRATAWSVSAATSTACRTQHAAARWRCTRWPRRSASSRTVRCSQPIPSWRAAISDASRRVTERPAPRCAGAEPAEPRSPAVAAT